ncbi:hypothetical protein [Photobacterium damselae]|uniref:hypothetical protein n=1 Tax=Photobacterium damselae TaxID=38293 RepID=UPI004068E4A7
MFKLIYLMMRTLTFKQVNKEWDALLSESIDKYEQGNNSPLVIIPELESASFTGWSIQKIDTEYNSLLNFGQSTWMIKQPSQIH